MWCVGITSSEPYKAGVHNQELNNVSESCNEKRLCFCFTGEHLKDIAPIMHKSLNVTARDKCLFSISATEHRTLKSKI